MTWINDYDNRWVDPSKTRDKATYPYAYSEFFIFGSREIIAAKGVSGEYSDRLNQRDSDKFSQCCKAHPGAWKGNKAALSRWVTQYFGRPLQAVALAEGCNSSNGYPYWIVWMKERAPRA